MEELQSVSAAGPETLGQRLAAEMGSRFVLHPQALALY